MAEGRCVWTPRWSESHSRDYGLSEAQVQACLNPPGPGQTGRRCKLYFAAESSNSEFSHTDQLTPSRARSPWCNIRARTLLFAVLTALLLAACAGTGPVPEDRFYRLGEIEPLRVYRPAPLAGVVQVGPFHGSALHAQRSLVYASADRPLQLDRYHYHHWVEPPPRLLERQLREFLERAGVAAEAVGADYPERPDYRVRAEIRRFEQIRSAQGQSVAVSLEFTVTRRGEARPVLHETFGVETAPVADGEVYASVELFRRALRQVYGQLARALAGAPAAEALAAGWNE